jgi:hypothetical protein
MGFKAISSGFRRPVDVRSPYEKISCGRPKEWEWLHFARFYIHYYSGNESQVLQ